MRSNIPLKHGTSKARYKYQKSPLEPTYFLSLSFRYWCVVSGGQFYEYTNWKKQLEPHNNPIDLRFASVREARNSERRFCFEIITPKIRRLYQATSQEEAEQWMSTVQNSIESVLNGTSSSTNFKDTFLSPSTSTPTSTSSSNKSHGSAKKKRSSRARSLSVVLRSVAPEKQAHDDTGKSLEVPSQPTATSLRSRWSSFHFGQTRKHLSFSTHAQARSIKTKSSINSISSKYDSIPTAELLSMLREDESNHSCADCGAKDPDWCSLNLGVLLCIGKNLFFLLLKNLIYSSPFFLIQNVQEFTEALAPIFQKYDH